MADLLGIGTAISGIANSVSTGITNRRNRKFQREMWDATNAYNTPLAQRQRMEQAGLNPNLLYGHGSVANTAQMANLPDATPIDFDQAIMGSLGKYQDIRNKRTDMKMQEQNIQSAVQNLELIKANTEKINAEKSNVLADVYLKSQTMPDNIKRAYLDNAAKEAGIALTNTQRLGVESNTALDKYREESMVADKYLKEMQAYQMPFDLKNRTAQTLSSINLQNVQAQEHMKRLGFMDQNNLWNISRIKADVDQVRTRTKGMSIENQINATKRHWQNLGMSVETVAKLTPLLYLLF